MRTLKTQVVPNWPDSAKIESEYTRTFLYDIGRLIIQMFKDIVADLKEIQSIDNVDSLPTASSALRGRMFLVRGGAGVADTLKVCIKDSTDTYVFKTVTIS